MVITQIANQLGATAEELKLSNLISREVLANIQQSYYIRPLCNQRNLIFMSDYITLCCLSDGMSFDEF